MSCYLPKRYSVVSRRKGDRRAYSDGYIYPDEESARREAQYKALSGHYSMVKIVDYETNELIQKFTKAKQ